MRLEDIHRLIAQSDKDDWNYIPCWAANTGPSFLYEWQKYHRSSGSWELELQYHHHIAACREDVNLSLAWGLPFNDDTKMRPEWVESFYKDFYCGQWLDVMWNGRPIERHLLAGVEDISGFGLLPVPLIDFADHGYQAAEGPAVHTVTQFESTLGRLVHSFEYDVEVYEKCLQRAGFLIVD